MSKDFLESLSNIQKTVDELLENPEGDLRFLRALYPKLKSGMDNMHNLLYDEVVSISKWLSVYQGKEEPANEKLDDYVKVTPIIETLVDEAFSPRSLYPANTLSASWTSSSSNNKKSFSVSNFDPNLPKGPKSINIFEENPLEKVLRSIKFEQSIFSIDLNTKIAFELDNLPDPVWIDDEKGLEVMVKEISQYPEIAVDLENHSFYSYNGYSCLMQISTRKQDYLVDTVALRHCLKAHLQTVFENPSIIKIFHGAESDIYWLQRDFGIFVASIFDSYYGSRKLGLERQSLAFLIKHFFDYDMDKSLQTADWRIRPLTAEMLTYAQLDTHCLFPLYDTMRIALISRYGRDGLEEVLRRSSQQAMKLYRPEAFDEKSAFKQLGQLKKELHDMAKSVMLWREFVAREMDICPYAVASPKDLKETILVRSPHRHIRKLPEKYVQRLEVILKGKNEEKPLPHESITKKKEHIFFEEESNVAKKSRTIRVKALSRIVGNSVSNSIQYSVKYAEAARIQLEEQQEHKKMIDTVEAVNTVKEYQPIRQKDGKIYNFDALVSAAPKEETVACGISATELPKPEFPSLTTASVKVEDVPKKSELKAKSSKQKSNINRPSKIFRRSKGKVTTFM